MSLSSLSSQTVFQRALVHEVVDLLLNILPKNKSRHFRLFSLQSARITERNLTRNNFKEKEKKLRKTNQVERTQVITQET